MSMNAFYSSIFMCGLAIVGAGNASHLKELAMGEILRSESLIISNGDISIELSPRQALPQNITPPPLGIETATSRAQIYCLAKNIQEEAQIEPLEGKIWLAWATINRVRSSQFLNSICGVIAEPNQMSWYKNPVKRNRAVSQESIKLAKDVLSGKYPYPFKKGTYPTNWDNYALDGKGTFNLRQMQKKATYYVKCKDCVHTFIAY